MNLADIQRLFAYDAWANTLMFDCIESLAEEQYTRALGSSYPNIRETLAHIVGSEWIWEQRLHGESPSVIPAWMNEATVASLRAKLEEVGRARDEFLASADIEQSISYRDLAGNPFTMKIADALQHVVNHSTYHRGQLTTMIRQVGATPPRTDLIVFMRL